MKIQIAQINPTVGDLVGNLAIMQGEIAKAHQDGCDVICFPELCTVGYPPKDLLYYDEVWDNHDKLVAKLKTFLGTLTDNITVIFGGLHRVNLTHGRTAKYNAAYIIDKHYEQIVHKRLLPCYDVFDENRYFQSGIGEPYIPVKIYLKDKVEFCDVIICEDMWNFRNIDKNHWLPATYTEDPVSNLKGDSVIFILNGSPYWRGKYEKTKSIVESITIHTHRPVVWVNQVGAHDDIITGGYSMFSYPSPYRHSDGCTINTMKFFAQDAMWFHAPSPSYRPPPVLKCLQTDFHLDKTHGETLDLACDYLALRLHIAEYCRKTGFKGAVIGLSGGVDSALVASLAADALGPENITGVALPSEFSSEHSITDAQQLAQNLGIQDFRIIPIKSAHQAIRNSLLSGGRQEFSSTLVDENIQPRCRMAILMAISNDTGRILLTTGNKSEIAQGYTTLYGDQAGGLAVISDLLKTRVYLLCEFINECNGSLPRIPSNTLKKAPSAELRPDQKDTDTLPPYELLDPVLEQIMMGVPIDEIAKTSKLAHKAIVAVHRRFVNSEFKRVQSAIGVKLTARSFSSGWRMPVASKLTGF